MRRLPLFLTASFLLACAGLFAPKKLPESEDTANSLGEHIDESPLTTLNGTWRYSLNGEGHRAVSIIEAAITGRARLISAAQPFEEEEKALFKFAQKNDKNPILKRLSELPKGANWVITDTTVTLTTRAGTHTAQLSETSLPSVFNLTFPQGDETWSVSFPSEFEAVIDIEEPVVVSYTIKRMN